MNAYEFVEALLVFNTACKSKKTIIINTHSGMELIKNIRIKHFKSLEDVEIKGCHRYNIFVGRPNVGKSNILEALTMFALPYMGGTHFSLPDFLRMERNTASLFFNGDVSKKIEITAGSHHFLLEHKSDNQVRFNTGGEDFSMVDLMVEQAADKYPIFKPYYYGKKSSASQINMPFLCPIVGENLMQVVKNNNELRAEITSLLANYGLKLALDTVNQKLMVMKPLDADTSCVIPYDAMADSLKRLVFYKAAIMSNTQSVLVMEEPEAHSYPPYIVKVIQTMLEADSNQYFITTHSPYVINEFLENKADVAIFLTDFVNGQTRIRALNDNELQQIYEDGIDLFFNTEFFEV